MGARTITGGMFSTDSYSTVRGVDKLISVDVYLPGCPPKPEAVIDAITKLRKNVEFLLDFIEKYISHGGNADFESRIASAAYEAEDLIEFHIVDQIPTEKSPNFLLDLQKVIEDMDCIKENAMKLQEERGLIDEQPTYSIPATSSSRPLTKTRMVGFDEELTQLLDVLTGEPSSQQIISVAGMGGIGKSTLVRNVYENSVIKEHFDVLAWATISQQHSETQILIDLLSSIEKHTTSETVQMLGEVLRKSLWSRRYLIILDDMWSVEVWDEIKFYFPENINGSRIVITTRLSNVATLCSSFCLRLNFLDKDKSWNLFCEMVFGCEDWPLELKMDGYEDLPLELKMVGKKIVKLCKGLPLSIAVIGGLIRRSCKTVEYWKNVAGDLNSLILSSEENEHCFDILSLSYDHLDVHLKLCFLYMGTFQEDKEIRASRIIKLWVAEGFVKPDGTRILEEIAEGYLKELVDRNLILVGRHRGNGKIRSCRIHDLLRDLCLMVSEKEQFFCSVREGALGINGVRRLIFHEFMSRDDNCQTFDALDSALLVRSLTCRGTKLPVEFRLLRVLNMAHNASPEAIFHNLNLRFFSYQPLVNLKLVVLPSSISLIWNLQTLAIQGKGTKLVIAPLEIWNLTQLRHVECTKVYLPDPPLHGRQDDEFAVLGNLQTLTKALNLKLSEEVCKRIPNINKLHLILDDKSKGYGACLFAYLHNLSSLHKLQSLNIVSLVENLPFCTGWLKHRTLPRSLNKLSLTKCSLHQKDLTIIGSLPQLGVLKLENSVVEEDWSPVCGQFISLKVLRVANCCLRRWNADSFHFPVLKKLILEGLWNLEEIPLGIGEIPTLELISVFNCSESAGISATAIKKEQESLGNDGLQIQVDQMLIRSLLEKIKISHFALKAALRFLGAPHLNIYKRQRSLDYSDNGHFFYLR